MQQRFLLFIILLFSLVARSQTLYWVGGSGNFQDGQHWSLTSGGSPAGISPSFSTDLIFDGQSSNGVFIVNIVGNISVKSLTCYQESHQLHFTGDQFSSITCAEKFILNSNTQYEANSKLIFNSSASTYHDVNFWQNKINADVEFENGNWNLLSVKLSDQNTLKINKGSYTLNQASVIAGNLEANQNNVSFSSNRGVFYVKNKFLLGPQVTFAANDLIVIAQKNNPQLYQVNSNINLGPNAKIYQTNPTPQACSITYTFTNPTCNGQCDASITIGFDAGCTTGPYDLIFNTAATCIPNGINGVMPPAVSLNSLCACGGNQLDIFVFDGSGFVTQLNGLNMPANPTPINLLFSSPVQPTCSGLCNGSVNIFVSGGAPGPGVGSYTVVASNGTATPTQTIVVPAVTNTTIPNICAGNYTFSVTDTKGCVRTFLNTFTEPAPLLANATTSNVTCFGTCNGSASSNPSGGVGPYTYSWSAPTSTPSSSSSSSYTNLCPGVITLTVTDSKSCTATYSNTITQPPAITLTVTKTNLNCASICNGTASVTATGGSGAGYSYTWSPSGSGSSSTGLCAGIYTVDVSDNLNCTKSVTFQITAPPTLTANPTQTNIACNGASTGSISLNPSGGTPAYTYSWSPNVSNTLTASGLPAGAYSYTITDALACPLVGNITLTQPLALTLTVNAFAAKCFSVCDGTANATVSGGTGPYTYSWTPGVITGQGTASVTSLCAGSYSLAVRDASNCPISTTFTITQPLPITPNVTTVSPTCGGLCNGSISSVPSGGTGAPYTFTLISSSGTPTVAAPPFTNLCAGSYTLQIGDAGTCTKTVTVTLTQPNPVTLNLNATPLNCFGGSNSTISSVIGGGTPGYTVTWGSGPSPGLTQTNQGQGVHTATVTDANGCTANASVNIVPPPDLTITITPTQPNCNGQCTGVATASVSGGTPNYNITWSIGGSGNTISNLCAGTYSATVVDNKGCTKIQSVSIIAPPALTLTPTNGTVSCSGACDGSVSVVATGGTPGYFYNWNSIPAQNTPTATGLCNGSYNVNVLDANGCPASTSANVSQPPVLSVSISNVQPSCNVCVGAATAAGIGGTAPYTYSWSPGGQTVPNPTDLCVGIQTVTVTDSKGCTSTRTVQINQTVILVLTSNGSTLTCNGVCSGMSTANASGGLSPYTYTWTSPPVSPVQNTQTANNLCAGVHTVIVADANGCSSSGMVTFFSPPAITLTVNKTDAKCNGVCSGSVTANASGGTGAISYLWQPGNITTPSMTNLCPGDYTLTATDANGCTQSTVVTIAQPASVTVTYTNTNPTTCTSSDGSISFTAVGGVAPYSFTWTPGGSVNPLVNQPDGTYILNLSDANGCAQSFTTSLSDPLGPTVTVTSNSIQCFGSCTGSATLSITGTPPYTVNWPTIPSTNTIVANLCSGTYAAQVTDATGCITNQTVNIAQPTQITSNGVVSNVACNGALTGSINFSPSGGTPGYTFNWSPAGGNVEDPTGLSSGSYTVNFMDANNCPATNSFVINQPLPLILSFNKKDVLCNDGTCTGAVGVNVTGGTAPYNYTWTPVGTFAGSTLDTIINLCTGIYSVNVIDANGCSASGTISIGVPAVLTSTITSKNLTCNGVCNGSAIINASGGTAPFSYSYTPGTPTQTISGLCVGNYSGTVTDANGCVVTGAFSISQPLPITITTTVSNPSCNGTASGSVVTSVSGGNPNYSFNWSPSGGSVQNPTGLSAGIYTVIVTDDSLCTGQSVVTLTNPATLVANISFTNPTCNGGCNGIVSANGVGGTAPYVYQWTAPTTNTQTLNGLCAGNYTVTVTDANSCIYTQTTSLTNPPSITINPAIIPANCGVNDGSIVANTSGGSPNYSYIWNPSVSTTSVAAGLGAGVYTVIVTDAASCSATVSIPLSNSNGPNGATITTTNVICNGQANGAATVSNPVGGTPSYTLSWVNPVSASASVTNLGPGTYTAQVIDANNCLYFQSATITEPQVIDANETIVNAQCFGICNGSISLNTTGGNGGYTYVWSNASVASSISNLCPGNYSVTITDALGCTLTSSYTVQGLTTITSSTVATNNLCFNDCNGTLLATNVAGGIPPFSFNWSDPLGQSTAQAIGLCNGVYSVTITDGNGCFNAIPGSITSPSAVTFTPAITQPGCDMCNGEAVVNPTGGTPVYSLVWSNTQTGNTATNLCSGVYMVQITDGNGCVSNTNVIINSSSGITGENIFQTDETCAGLCNGTVSITAVGGAAPISYHWVHNGSSSPSQTNLCPGTYFCNMTDLNGCTRTASVVIGSAVSLSVTPQVTQSSCTANTGSVVVSVAGGTGPYTYSWLPGTVSSVTNTATNLSPGSYTLTTSDANGCSDTKIFSIGTINGPVITYSQTNITCTSSGVCDGSIGVVINNGTPGYTTTWSTGVTGTTSISALCPGSYSVLVVDNAGCSAVQNFSLTGVPPLTFSAPDSDSPVCNNDCNGSVTALPIGGTLPYTFAWLPVGSGTTINNLCAGNYSVSITDANGCVVSQTYTLINPPTMTLTALITDASCNTVADGSIDITNGGGIAPYTYSWTPINLPAQDLTNVLSGTYSLSIADLNGCVLDSVFTVNSTVVVIAIAGNDTTFCQNGTLNLDGSNSSGGITYQWLEIPGGTLISNTLIAVVTPSTGVSSYELVATNGACVDRDTIQVTSNTLPVVDAGPMLSIPLFGNGVIGGNPTCATGTSFSWTPNMALDNPIGTNPTTSTTVTTIYTVTVVDNNGCINSDTVTVFVYPEIRIPNGFSPNADGKNDTWVIDFIQQFPDCEVEVYNRWGEQLFYSKGYPIPWNGQYKGKDLPVGTYYYVINLNHPAYPNAYTSPLTIFR